MYTSKLLNLLNLLIFFFITFSCYAQEGYQRDAWLSKAEAVKPVLKKTNNKPIGVVSLRKDQAAFQGWTVSEASPMDSLYKQSFKIKKEVIVDFGKHLTGYFGMGIKVLNATPDAPLRFKLTFAEVPGELATAFDPYDGDLSRAWLQDEVVTVMTVPALIELPRRLAFRYVKIELLGSSQYYDFSLENIHCTSVSSSVDLPHDLISGSSDLIKKIDQVGLNTLKECMQTVYEDGPKRDQRLWVGDLYLESLANTYSFKQHDLTKRCLYLLAGLADERGYVYGTVFEEPTPHPQEKQFLMDYSFLYNCTLLEYFLATHDKQTAEDLWPVVKQHINIIFEYLGNDGLIDYTRANKEWWLFFDWKTDLHKQAALQGLSIYTLKKTYELAQQLGKTGEIKNVPAIIEKMSRAAKSTFYNKSRGLIESGENKQVSYASQIWMTLSGVLNKNEAQKALKNIVSDPGAVTAGTPYLYHYYVQACIDAGLPAIARSALEDYWGGMVRKGADTFWEAYDPKNDLLSPYRFHPINSYCHAWSCTPVYFIRKYPEIFQR